MRRDPLIAAALGALILLAVGARFTPGPLVLARLAILGGALGALAVFDLRERRIPNRIVLPATAACAALTLAEGIHPSTELYLGAIIVTVLLLVSFAAPAVLGMGDVKLALLILCALDGRTSLALLIALEIYALIALLLLIWWGRAALGASLPLAPIISAGCLIAVLR